MPLPDELVERARELAAQIGRARPMRRGSLGERYVKCSKPGCPCGEEPTARHGPYFSLTRTVDGATRSRLLSARQAELAGRQLQAGRAFRRALDALWELCEQWADAQLLAVETSSPEAVEKGGSKLALPQRSRRRSRRSSASVR